jgi:hypothetical protein
MKNKMLSSLALSVAAAVLTQPLFAGIIPAHDIQITENSSTSLSATFDGTPVTVQNTAKDRWTITFDPTFQFGVFVLNGYVEPENNLVNIIDSEPGVGGFGTNQLFVLSDIQGGSFIPDGTTLVETLLISGSQTAVGITFHDSGDGSSVPDSGSTLGLFLFALIGVLGATRLRSPRLVVERPVIA